MTPYEAWTGQKPSLSNLRVFGCCAYVHVLAKNRSKLGAKAVRCVFIGYPAGSKAYLLWNPQTGKTLISRDVHFVEDQLGLPVAGADGGGNDQSLNTSSISVMSREEAQHMRAEQKLDDDDSTYVDEDLEHNYSDSDSVLADSDNGSNSEPVVDRQPRLQ